METANLRPLLPSPSSSIMAPAAGLAAPTPSAGAGGANRKAFQVSPHLARFISPLTVSPPRSQNNEKSTEVRLSNMTAAKGKRSLLFLLVSEMFSTRR